jgi:hypothetical protein
MTDHRALTVLLALLLCTPLSTSCDDWEPEPDVPIDCTTGVGLRVPDAGSMYHGVFPGDESEDDEEDGVSDALVRSYEDAVGRDVAWVYFSDNWYRDRDFPTQTATWIRDRGSLPFIRLMLRSGPEQDVAERTFTLEDIATGVFDDDLVAWGEAAAEFGTPVVVEWGTEVNGEWFAWNGAWNGADEVAPRRFRAAYRHIVSTVCETGASNVTWAWHVGTEDIPEEPWNRLEQYYPGDDAVDWVGVSDYGALDPMDDEWPAFETGMESVLPRLAEVAPTKPVFVFEFGVSGGNPLGDPADWTDAALEDLVGGRWPEVRGFSWWNERWENDDDPAHDSVLVVQDLPGVPEVFQEHLASAAVLDEPLLD